MANRGALYERIRDAGQHRVVDLGVRVQVHRRDGGKVYPAEFLGDEHGPYVWGGRYDDRVGEYTGPPQAVVTLACHPGQVGLLTFRDPSQQIRRVLCIGAPGGGKTKAVVLKGVLEGAKAAHRIIGMVAPTAARLKIMWSKFLETVSPLGWIDDVSPQEHEITLVNGVLYQFRAAKQASAALGVPVQGYDWDVAIEDEQQNMTDQALLEVDLRGRRAGTSYVVYSTATNQLISEFQERLGVYERAPHVKVLRFSGYENSWIDPAYWDSFRGRLSAVQFRRLIDGERPPIEGRIYPCFDLDLNVAPRPITRRDITEKVTHERYGEPFRWIVGQDFGQRVNASTVFKCFAGDGPNERLWWAVGELATVDGAGITAHVPRLISWMRETFGAGPKEILVVGDPHCSRTRSNDGASESDYSVMQRAGFHAVKAAYGKQIPRRDRFGMVNTLLCDGDGVRRLFVEKLEDGTPACPDMVRSFQFYGWGPSGEPQQFNKDGRDPSHYTDTCYALIPWESLRGQEAPKQHSPADAVRSIEERRMRNARGDA